MTPIIKSSREIKKYSASSDEVSNRLFLVSTNKNNLPSEVLDYIEFGSDQEIWDNNAPAYRSSCQGRLKWYALGERRIPDICCNYMIDTMMRFFDYDSLVVDNFQEIHLYQRIKEKALISLNSTLFNLFLNIVGRGNFGDGLMKLQTFEVADLVTFDPNLLEEIPKSSFLNREVHGIFEELGFNKNLEIRSQNPNPLADRKALDDLIFHHLELTEEERKEVYWATAELVKQRLDKAGSR